MSDSVQSRSEGIVRDIVDNTSVYPHKKGKSRLEDLFIELLEEGGGGSSSDYATALSLTINPSTFVMTGQLLNKDGDPLGTAQTIDLPLESVVVNGAYDSQTDEVVLTLQNGNTIRFSVAALVNGLQSEITAQNKLSADLVDDTSTTNKFVTAGDKTNWDGKLTPVEVTQAEYDALPASKTSDGKLYLITDASSTIPVDSTLSTTSENPVQNKVITNTLNGKQDVIDSNHKLGADLVDDSTATNKFVTATEKTTISKAVTTDDIGIESNYYVYNGIRIYVSATEPTGTIPDNSVWLDPNDSVDFFNPTNHNGIFRGKDLTNVYTVEEMYAMIHDGTFKDLYLGDYFTKSIATDIYTHFAGAEFESGTTYYEMDGTINDRTWTETSDATPQSGKTYATKQSKTENVTLMFTAFDYYYNVGDTALTAHHAVLIPETCFATTANMNPTNTTVGGYYNSDMHQITLPCYAKSLKTMLGNHLLSHKTWLTTTVKTTTPSMAGAGMTGAATASAWQETELQLMNEVQLYGSTIWSSSAYDVGVDNAKLPVFNFISPVRYGRKLFWLRSVVSSTNFAYCGTSGTATSYGASNAFYVRPMILFG